MSTAMPCLGNNSTCGNPTTSPDRLCHVHEHLGYSITPGQAVAFRSIGVIGLRARLNKEAVHPVPRNSARVDGFPYFTREDAEQADQWRRGDESARPDYGEILDRYPIYSPECLGSQLTGREIGIYDSDGQVHTFVPDEHGNATVYETSTDAHGRTVSLYAVSYGYPFAVESAKTYQIVALDLARLDSAIRG